MSFTSPNRRKDFLNSNEVDESVCFSYSLCRPEMSIYCGEILDLV
jgi:hypothetical protein